MVPWSQIGEFIVANRVCRITILSMIGGFGPMGIAGTKHHTSHRHDPKLQKEIVSKHHTLMAKSYPTPCTNVVHVESWGNFGFQGAKKHLLPSRQSIDITWTCTSNMTGASLHWPTKYGAEKGVRISWASLTPHPPHCRPALPIHSHCLPLPPNPLPCLLPPTCSISLTIWAFQQQVLGGTPSCYSSGTWHYVLL